MQNQDLLFNGNSLSDIIRNLPNAISERIQKESRDYIMNVNESVYLEHIVSEYKINAIELDQDQTEVFKQFEQDEKINDFGRYINVKRNYITFAIPFSGDHGLFDLQPDTYTLSPPRGKVISQPKELHITLSDSGDATFIKQELQRQLASIQSYLGYQRQSLTVWNNSLHSLAESTFRSRKNKFLADAGVAESLGFPLRKREGASTYTVPVRKKISISKPSAPNSPYQAHPSLDEEIYKDILKTLRNMTLVMERSPSSFASINEEGLRMHFLAQLNGVYEGAATGETFNYEGKTDILLRKDGKNLFIAECKFWGGPKVFTETIDQLLNYLTWRDSKTAVIVFVRDTAMSTVNEKIPSLLREHPSYISGVDTPNHCEGEFRCRMKSARDVNLSLDVTVQVYHVPNKQS